MKVSDKYNIGIKKSTATIMFAHKSLRLKIESYNVKTSILLPENQLMCYVYF